MNIPPQFIAFLNAGVLMASAHSEELKQAYLDNKQNAHVVTAHGRDLKITRNGNVGSLKLAPDSETVAWLVMNTWTAECDDEPRSQELVIYRNGKSRSIKCTPFIRDYWFWMNGSQIAIDCGSQHFAGHQILYDSKTLHELASFDEAKVPLEKRPVWSDADD